MNRTQPRRDLRTCRASPRRAPAGTPRRAGRPRNAPPHSRRVTTWRGGGRADLVDPALDPSGPSSSRSSPSRPFGRLANPVGTRSSPARNEAGRRTGVDGVPKLAEHLPERSALELEVDEHMIGVVTAIVSPEQGPPRATRVELQIDPIASGRRTDPMNTSAHAGDRCHGRRAGRPPPGQRRGQDRPCTRPRRGAGSTDRPRQVEPAEPRRLDDCSRSRPMRRADRARRRQSRTDAGLRRRDEGVGLCDRIGDRLLAVRHRHPLQRRASDRRMPRCRGRD